VYFQTDLVEDFHDRVIIKSEDGLVQEVAIHALKA
jgi:hypothetical protein